MTLQNADIRFDALTLGGRAVQIAVPQMPNNCWLSSLVTAIGPVAREEIDREMTGAKAGLLKALSHGFEAFARLFRLDDVVFPEHRLFSTSLYDEGELAHLIAHMPELVRRYPDKAIVLRSLNTHDHGDFINIDSWPFRIVWIIDDTARDWRPRRDSRRDLSLLKQLNMQQKTYGADMPEDRLQQCLDLYRHLYIDAYSPHNPDYTTAWLRQCLKDGGLQIATLESSGRVEAFCALHGRGDTLSLPLLGYNRDRPQGDGLYRAAMALGALAAEARGLRLNLSAGAPDFKRHRGALSHMEYLRIFDDHLPLWRRLAYRLTGAILRRLAPELKRTAGL